MASGGLSRVAVCGSSLWQGKLSLDHHPGSSACRCRRCDRANVCTYRQKYRRQLGERQFRKPRWILEDALSTRSGRIQGRADLRWSAVFCVALFHLLIEQDNHSALVIGAAALIGLALMFLLRWHCRSMYPGTDRRHHAVIRCQADPAIE